MLYILLLIGAILVLLIPSTMLKLAVSVVVKEFRRQNAVSPENTISKTDLGIMPQTGINRFVNRRDYKAQALQALIQAEIVQVTEEGRLYLLEEKLESTRWAKK